jgi:hypothetical protein
MSQSVQSPKYAVQFEPEQVTFKDAKGNIETFANLHSIAENEAIKTLRKEGDARKYATVGALSILVHMLDNPRLDGYKGKTLPNAKLPKELKTAKRELEDEYLKPLFMADVQKGKETPQSIANNSLLWDKFISEQRAGGVWSLMGSVALQYFAIVGQLPCVYIDGKPQKDQLLCKGAMEKIIANLRAASDTTDKGISGKIVDLAEALRSRTEKTHIGHIASAIASLKDMLATFEGLLREEAETAQREHELRSVGDVTPKADAAILKAQKVNADTENSLKKLWDKGTITDDQFQARMKAIGIDVELVDPVTA